MAGQKRGQKPRLTPELAEQAIQLVKGGASNQDVIAWLGIGDSTFYRWLREPKDEAQEALAEGMKRAETERKLWHLQRIHKAAENGDWKASAWYLERRYPNEYARTQRIAGTVETVSKTDALTEAIRETVRLMEGGRGEPDA